MLALMQCKAHANDAAAMPMQNVQAEMCVLLDAHSRVAVLAALYKCNDQVSDKIIVVGRVA